MKSPKRVTHIFWMAPQSKTQNHWKMFEHILDSHSAIQRIQMDSQSQTWKSHHRSQLFAVEDWRFQRQNWTWGLCLRHHQRHFDELLRERLWRGFVFCVSNSKAKALFYLKGTIHKWRHLYLVLTYDKDTNYRNNCLLGSLLLLDKN